MDSFENIHFIIDFSCAEHVEDLKPYEHVEHDSQVPGCCVMVVFLVMDVTRVVKEHAIHDQWARKRFQIIHLAIWNVFAIFPYALLFGIFWKELRAGKHEDEKKDCLEDSLTKDMFNHFSADDVLLLSVWWSLEKFLSWKLGG